MTSRNYWKNAAGATFSGLIQPEGDDWVITDQEEFDTAPPTPTPHVTFGALLSRLTRAERTQLREDRLFDSDLSDAMFVMQHRWRLNLQGPAVQVFLALLVRELIIKPERPAQILAAPVTQDELAS